VEEEDEDDRGVVMGEIVEISVELCQLPNIRGLLMKNIWMCWKTMAYCTHFVSVLTNPERNCLLLLQVELLSYYHANLKQFKSM
jgi:hypothetical protein